MKRSRSWRSLAVSGLVTAVVMLPVTGLQVAGGFQFLELKVYDLLVRFQPRRTISTHRIAIVGLDERGIEQLGHYPINDQVMAELLRRILAGRPAAIGIDIFRDLAVPPGRDQLNHVLGRHENIYVSEMFGRINPPAILQGTDQVGFLDALLDDDGTIRKGLLFLSHADTGTTGTPPREEAEPPAWSLGLRLAYHYLLDHSPSGQLSFDYVDPADPDRIQVNGAILTRFRSHDGAYVDADDNGFQILMDYRAPQAFHTYRLLDVLRGEVTAEAFRDKVVIVGITAQSVKDHVRTPLTSRQHGVHVVAHLVDQLMRAGLVGDEPMRSWPGWGESAWTLLLGVAGGVVGWRIRKPMNYGLIVITAVAGMVLLAYLAFRLGWWIPVLPPVMGWTLSATGVTTCMSYYERQDRLVLKRLFEAHVSEPVVDMVWRNRDEIFQQGRLVPQQITATVLFADIRDFTVIAERSTAANLMRWLNEFVTPMSQLVTQHDGMVNKYLGDAVMAVFGAPVPIHDSSQQPADAIHAVTCALQMRLALARLNDRWQRCDQPTIQMRIGIHTGPLVAGSVGCGQRLEYTVIGDTVNIASRLESFDKHQMPPDIAALGCRILISDATLQRLGGRFATRSMGQIIIRGRQQQVVVHGLVGDS